MAHNTIIPETIDPLQFAYRPNRSTDDAISIALHTALSHLGLKDPGTKHLPLQLDPVFADGPLPGGKDR